MPWVIPLIGAGVGVWQTLSANKRAKEARRDLEKMQVPKVDSDAGVSRYYNEALKRYNTAPTSTAMYKNAMFNINRNQAMALSALKDRRSLIGGVSNIVGRSNDAAIGAAAAAEREQSNRFNQLGGATGMKRGDNMYRFNQNEIEPYQKNLTLAGMKAAANAATMNTGIQNIYSGLSNYALMQSGMYNPQTGTQPPNEPTSYYNLVSPPYGGYRGN